MVYDAISRQPVSGTIVTLLGASGNPLPTACFLDAAQQNQLTDARGMYRFDIIPGAAAACPAGETEYRIIFDAPGSYSDAPSSVIAPQPDALNPTSGIGAFLVVPQVTAPSAGVTGGDRINTGLARNGFDAAEIFNRGQAVISIVSSTIFDCAEIIGKVFGDHGGDGYQDKGEPGIAGVRLADVNGQLITTDEEGRYHITCAAIPDARIGSNYILKLDTRTLPTGYSVTSENPRAVRLTRGKITKLNFGAQLSKRVMVTLDSRAFMTGSVDMKVALNKQIAALRSLVDPKNPAVRIDYSLAEGEDMALAQSAS